MKLTAEQHIAIYNAKKGERAALESYWQDLAYFCMPRKAYITRYRTLADRRPIDLYNSTSVTSAKYLASGLQGYMTNPQTRWMQSTIDDVNLLSGYGVRDWLRIVDDVMFSTFDKSNFYSDDFEAYLDMSVIGNNCTFIEEDIDSDVRFTSVPVANILPIANSRGIVDRIYILYEYTASQAVEKFGADAVGTKVREAFGKKDETTKFQYLQAIYPRGYYDQRKSDARNMPYASDWIDINMKQVIREGGFREKPFCFSRFYKQSGDPHGDSPAMDVLSDIKMLNAMELTNLIGAQKVVDPPLMVPDEAFMKPLDFNAGGVNIRNVGQPDEKIEPIITGAQVPIGIELTDRKEAKIQQAFFNDLFIVLQQAGKMTATEVNARISERMLLLGPVLGHIMTERLAPIYDRVFAIQFRNGKIPEPPRALMGREVKPRYTSPLARAQRQIELGSIQNAIALIAQFAQVNPDVLDKIDFDVATDEVAEITGLNPKIIREDSDVEQIRSQRAAEKQTALQMAAMQQGTEIVKTATDADRNIAAAGAPAGKAGAA